MEVPVPTLEATYDPLLRLDRDGSYLLYWVANFLLRPLIATVRLRANKSHILGLAVRHVGRFSNNK